MTARGRTWLRRTTILAVAGATAATGTTMALAAPGKGSPGSGFGSINISAVSSAVRAPLFSNGGEEVAAEAPYAEAVLSSGLSSHSLTSVFWPGGTGGNGGSTLLTATNGCLPPAPAPCLVQPPNAVWQALNDPEKAQAQSGAGKSVDDNSQDGITQRAVAKPTVVSAQTTIAGSKVPQVSEAFGTTNATSSIKITGPKTAVVTATSSLHDVKLAGGVIKIASIASSAAATSDTVKGTGKAATTIVGASVAGVPVTIDGSGVHVKGQGSRLPSLTDTVNKALKQLGVSIYLAKPTKTVKGANVSIDAGNLIVLFQQSQYVQQANDTGTLLVLGGATITANTSKGFVVKTTNPSQTTPTGSGATSGGGGGATGSSGGAPAGGSVSVPSGGATTGGSDAGAAPTVAAPANPGLAASAAHLLTGYGTVWAILGALVAAGLAFGLRRLPDQVFDTPTVACPLED